MLITSLITPLLNVTHQKCYDETSRGEYLKVFEVFFLKLI